MVAVRASKAVVIRAAGAVLRRHPTCQWPGRCFSAGQPAANRASTPTVPKVCASTRAVSVRARGGRVGRAGERANGCLCAKGVSHKELGGQ